jgi:hypothetical protein
MHVKCWLSGLAAAIAGLASDSPTRVRMLARASIADVFFVSEKVIAHALRKVIVHAFWKEIGEVRESVLVGLCM